MGNNSSDIKISALKSSAEMTPEIAEGISGLLPQLSSSAESISASALEEIISDKCVIFVAQDGSVLIGSLTLVFYTTPTAKRARIEDVVVDENHRGRGIGKMLNTAALNVAKDLGAKTVDLTSSPDREVANELYKKLGFELRKTNTYRKIL